MISLTVFAIDEGNRFLAPIGILAFILCADIAPRIATWMRALTPPMTLVRSVCGRTMIFEIRIKLIQLLRF